MQAKKRTKRKFREKKCMPTTAAVDRDRPLLTVRETADFLRISQSLIWSEIKKGNLKPLRLGDRVLFSRVYLQRLLEAE
jgi:excisionase family DNA binding protein